MQVLIFAALFVFIYILIKRVIINNLKKINDTLGRITEGDLNVTVDVRSNEEFSSLSDDINSTVTTLKRYIAEAAARIDKELEYAKQIQLSALPTNFPNGDDYSIYARMIAAKEVGGDFYDFFLTDNNHLALVIADVSDKGIPAALFMMESMALIRNRMMNGCDPATALEWVNRQLCQHNASKMFVTVWLAVLDIATGRGLACNAGHEPPALRRKGENFELLRYRHDFLVGGLPDTRYQNRAFELHPGDSLFVYTDGVPEATSGSGRLFAGERLEMTLNACQGCGPEEILRRVKGAVDAFVGDAEQFDDLTMMCLEYRGPEACGETVGKDA
jgi:serine phosphatase RsbU (regulator of sigma subunit)